jgi:hypothetical protein
MEEEHQFRQENVYQNDMLVQHRFYVLMMNDETQAKLIVEEIVKGLYNQLNYEYELYYIYILWLLQILFNTYDQLEESNI